MTIRTNAFSLLAAGVVVASAIYACSSSSNNSTKPPLNEAGADVTSSSSGGSTSSSSGSSSGGASSSSGGTGEGGTDGGPAPACSTLPGTIVYIESGDTQEPLLKSLGRQLRDQANVTIVFELTGSCTLTPNLYAGTAIPANTSMLYIPSSTENPSWNPSTSAESTCTTTAATVPNLGISALFPSSCAGQGAAPSGMSNFIGPIQAYTFIVPSTEFTTQTAITAEEAYYAFGDGASNPVTYGGNPEWATPSQFFLRPSTKSTLVATALNIGLTAKEMADPSADGGGADGRQLLASSDDVLAGVKAAGTDTPLQAIGILGDEVYDANRNDGVNVLAFSAFGEGSAYYPDSTTTSFDKQNIRDGHYSLWSPTVYITPVDTNGVPTNSTIKYITDLVLGNPNPTPPNGLVDGGTAIDGIGTVVSVGLTPSCAMQVTRAGDGKPVTPTNTPTTCTCYFLSKIPNAGTLPASCTACTSSTTCPNGEACSNGYCEGGDTSVTATAIAKAGVVYPGDGGLEPVSQ